MARPERAEPSLPYIEAMLNYLNNSGEKPESYGGVSQNVADQMRKGKYQEHPMRVYNGRAIAGQLSLEREGFILVNHKTRMNDFYDEAEVRSVYYKETEALVKETAGARRVLVFDHTLRSADQAMREQKQISGPVRNAHNDYTEWSGPQRVRDLLPDEAEALAQTSLCRCPDMAPDQQTGRARPVGDRRRAQPRARGTRAKRAYLSGPAWRGISLDL